MGTTNLLVWNPTAVNQENDAAYLADSQRAGGATDPSLFDATLANKLFYQLSTYLTAQYAAFAAKGFTTSDSNLATLTAQCANWLTTADVLPAVQLVTYAASVTLNAAQANGFYIVGMTGNLTIAGVTGLGSGQVVAMYYQQDSAGGRVVTFPSVMVGAAQPDPTANAVSLQMFGYDTTTGKLRAFGPLISNNEAVFTGAASVPGLATLGSLTLTSPGSAGQVLTNNGSGIFVPTDPIRAQGAVTDYSGGGRAANTVYQNTSGGVLLVSGSILTQGSGVGNIGVQIGPTTGVAVTAWANQATATVDNGDAGFYAAVPNNWYYKVVPLGYVNRGVHVWTETVVS